MRILFVLHLFTHTRHFHMVFEELLAREHTVEIVGLNSLVNHSARVHRPAHVKHIAPLEFFMLPPHRTDFWAACARGLRGTRNLLLYTKPVFQNATVFRRRAEKFADPFLMRLASTWGRHRLNWLDRCCRMLEAAIPADPAVIELLADRRPDVLLVSPLISHEMLMLNEHVKAAHALGIPVGFPVFSWDNLTTKGTTQVLPDRMFVWNEIQRIEGIELHGWPGDRIEVLGAWRFDEFTRLKPKTNRAEFCSARGFDPEQRTLLYIGSSPIVAPKEVDFVRAWLAMVRGSADATLRNANVLIRPHPRNLEAWRGVRDLGPYPRVTLENINELSLFETESLFEDLYHSDSVVGLITSAMIEAALLGKPVHSVITRVAGDGQSGTVHFDYLNTAGGGLLYLAHDLHGHEELLATHLRRPLGAPDARAQQFVRAFVHCRADGNSSTKALADAIERLAHMQKAPARPRRRDRIVRTFLALGLRSGMLPIGRNG